MTAESKSARRGGATKAVGGDAEQALLGSGYTLAQDIPVIRALSTGGGRQIRVMREDAFERARRAANKGIA